MKEVEVQKSAELVQKVHTKNQPDGCLLNERSRRMRKSLFESKGIQGRGFTLIELLIVVAIIAILAAIAVPNFLEAQTRAKVSRVKADMRSLATAIEAYYVDYNRHPIAWQGFKEVDPDTFNLRLRPVTTPISYITSLPIDIFWQQTTSFPATPGQPPTFEYVDYTTAVVGETLPGMAPFNLFATRKALDDYYGRQGQVYWYMNSAGPDRINDFQNNPTNPLSKPVTEANALLEGTNRTYDPTNGTVSVGDIARTSSQQRN